MGFYDLIANKLRLAFSGILRPRRFLLFATHLLNSRVMARISLRMLFFCRGMVVGLLTYTSALTKNTKENIYNVRFSYFTY